MLHTFKDLDDGFRVEPIGGRDTEGNIPARIRRDFVPPLPEGSFVVMVFKVVGYNHDCDGSAMARLQHVDLAGKTSGWEPSNIRLDSNSELVVDHPNDLLELV